VSPKKHATPAEAAVGQDARQAIEKVVADLESQREARAAAKRAAARAALPAYVSALSDIVAGKPVDREQFAAAAAALDLTAGELARDLAMVKQVREAEPHLAPYRQATKEREAIRKEIHDLGESKGRHSRLGHAKDAVVREARPMQACAANARRPDLQRLFYPPKSGLKPTLLCDPAPTKPESEWP